MKKLTIGISCLLATATATWAVYAPIPEQDGGKTLTISASGGIMSDSNIFGAATSEIDSTVFNFSPKVEYDGNVTDQTFVTAMYTLSIDHFDNRPGNKTLESHTLFGRVAQAFTSATTLDFTDQFMSQKNPASLLAGLPVNSDQSFKSNEANLSFTTPITAKAGITLKARSANFKYDSDKLGTNLDRTENLFGVSGTYAILPELKGSAEYRYQTIDYDSGGSTKNKRSDYVLAGLDYAVAKKTSLTAKIGNENRRREGASSTSAPYVELSGKYSYGEKSYVSGGVVHTYEEASNVIQYTDTLVNRYFVNLQHAVTPRIYVSGSLDFEPSTLKGRPGFASAKENATHYGAAVTYLYGTHWTASVTCDNDRVTSDDSSRDLKRNRFGVSGVFTY